MPLPVLMGRGEAPVKTTGNNSPRKIPENSPELLPALVRKKSVKFLPLVLRPRRPARK